MEQNAPTPTASHPLQSPLLASARRSLYFPDSYSSDAALRRGGITALGILAPRRQRLREGIMDNGGGFPFMRKLETHTSCVNAITFSRGNGRFLASGGDDLRICLWDFHQEDVKTPSFTMRGPRGNVFCLEFSATNRYIYSAGLCETIYKYDISSLGLPEAAASTNNRYPDHTYRDHQDSIRALTCHPVQDEVFMSVSEDGTIRRFDGRQPSKRTATNDIIQTENEVTGVQYHPTVDHLFATSDGAGRVFLRDTRMAFGPLTKRSNEGIVQRYNTKLTKKSTARLSNPETSSITFDRDGSRLAVTFLHYLPTIYALSDPNPVAVLSGKNLPDGTPNPPGQRTYSNSCTMKHGSFGGPGVDADDMYAGGSDDFRCYIWKIPPLQQLVDKRRVFSADDWTSFGEENTIAFTESRQHPKVVPVEISTPFCRLTGHKSIVNTTVFHPHLLHIATAGIEKNVILHSPTPSSPCTQNLDSSPVTVRKLLGDEDDKDRENYYAAMLGLIPADSENDQNERQTLSFFDHILREEGNADVFAQRPWKSPDVSDEEEDQDSDSDADDLSR
ncbi:hypothetical protein GALMADRAFT_238461 [Galerina marginata CBS 339.88]|uniref:Uncharacterized protein n=1 Tax=Galerina marginata (strain CBS 339.88) TaxID=685588 RepID=A0A067TKI6_GALM3|nr:hypothetical protein GALMADRAFT_238461 [Galerina marginata CBS 339.88]